MLWHSVVLMNEGFFDGLGKCLIVKISCQDLRFKHLNFLYIYPISYKIAKKANPEKRFAQIEKRYHTNFYRHDTCDSLGDIS